MNRSKSAITITFGDQAENHVGMQKIGSLADEGFTTEELQEAFETMCDSGWDVEYVDLYGLLEDVGYDESDRCKYDAGVLVIRGGIQAMLGDPDASDAMYEEQAGLEVDKKALMYGRVVNKSARYNLCFGEFSQEPEYETGKGRVVDFKDVPYTRAIREGLPLWLGEKGRDLQAEGNYYYDASKCGIGWHGDSERKKVVAARLGVSNPLMYQWFLQGEPIGDLIELDIGHGDMYVMSEKATGYDWKRKVIPTLRHAAGCEKFTRLPGKK